MKRGLPILLLATLFSGCMKHESLLDEGKAKEEAEKNFPVKNIHPDQDWVMATSRTLNVTVNEKTGETYTIKVFNDNPFDTESDVRLLAQKEVKDGQSATIKFDAPTILERVYVMRQLGEEYVVRLSDMKNELFSVTFGEIESRSARAGSTMPTIDTSKYATFNENAQRIDEGKKLKNLEKGAWYIDSEIEYKGDISLGPNACLYIKNGAWLKVNELKMESTNSFISVLEGGRLTIKDDFVLNGDKGSNGSTAFYNNGIVEADDVELEKGLWINEASFTANEFKVSKGGEAWNRCRLIITGEDDEDNDEDDKDDDDSFKLEKKAVFNNEGYVYVSKGGVEWEESVINLAGNAVFNIAGKLEIDKSVRLSATGTKTLIVAGEVDFDDDGRLSVSGTINVCSTDIENLPRNVNVVSETITDTGGCTVHSTLNPVPEILPAVTTYGFEDTMDGTTDYDFNDVVLHVSNPVDNKITVILVAAGATNPIKVQYSLDDGSNYSDLLFNGESEVHAAFRAPVTQMINTDRPITVTDASHPFAEIENVPDDFSFVDNGRICIWVNGTTRIDSQKKDEVPYALSVPIAWAYPTERVRIDAVYPNFIQWAENMTNEDWYMPKSEQGI